MVANIPFRIVKLVKNFRSHPDILDFPNRVFYGGDLRPHGRPAIINAYLQWSHLPKKGFPVIFHAVAGEDKREASSPSYFNIDEITQVKTYIKLLLADRQVPIGELSCLLCGERQKVLTCGYRGERHWRNHALSCPSYENPQRTSVDIWEGHPGC